MYIVIVFVYIYIYIYIHIILYIICQRTASMMFRFEVSNFHSLINGFDGWECACGGQSFWRDSTFLLEVHVHSGHARLVYIPQRGGAVETDCRDLYDVIY